MPEADPVIRLLLFPDIMIREVTQNKKEEGSPQENRL
jgi:hypothetical protein